MQRAIVYWPSSDTVKHGHVDTAVATPSKRVRQERQSADLILRAVAFAAHKHRDQRRKDKEASPYINHPIALAHVLANEGGIDDPVVLCAALLHDTIEDTETTAAEIEAAFGPRIAAVVIEVSDDRGLSKSERKRLQIEHAARASREAQWVKLADKICNLRDLLAAPPQDFDADGTRRIEAARPSPDFLRQGNLP